MRSARKIQSFHDFYSQLLFVTKTTTTTSRQYTHQSSFDRSSNELFPEQVSNDPKDGQGESNNHGADAPLVFCTLVLEVKVELTVEGNQSNDVECSKCKPCHKATGWWWGYFGVGFRVRHGEESSDFLVVVVVDKRAGFGSMEGAMNAHQSLVRPG
jgi:hypothetical protein